MTEKLKVLISDDNKEFCAQCDAFLRSYSIESVFVARDGVKLLQTILDVRPDVVLMDVFMPRLDAIGVMKAIKAEKLDSEPMFMVMPTFDNGTLECELLASGAAYYFLRPFDVAMLVERINQLTSRTSITRAVKRTMPDLEVLVTETIHQVGVPAHIKGYHYLRSAIMMAVENPDIINLVTKQLYPSLAKNFQTTSSRVERAIRHAIEVAWDRGDVDVLTSYFGYTIHNTKGKPTNSEFIALISDKLRLKLKQEIG